MLERIVEKCEEKIKQIIYNNIVNEKQGKR